MKCAKIINGKLEFKQVPIPTTLNGERLIKVNAFAINRADLLQIDGLYNAPSGSNIPGLEVAGIDVETGEEVCALVESGGYAEYVCANSLHIVPAPQSFNLEESAAFLEALITGNMNIFYNATASAGETILIHGGSSGVGSFAIKMCKLKGLHVIATTSDLSKSNKCFGLGADSVMDYTEDFDIKLKGQVDIILDILGGDYLNKNLSCLKLGGRLCLIAMMTGSKAQINLSSVLMKNLKIIGSTLRSKGAEDKHKLIKSAMQAFGKHIELGELKPTIDSVYPFTDLPKALQRVASRKHFGKVVVVI